MSDFGGNVLITIAVVIVVLSPLAIIYCIHQMRECDKELSRCDYKIHRLQHPRCEVCGQKFTNYDAIDSIVQTTKPPYFKCICRHCSKTYHFWLDGKNNDDNIDYCILKRDE